MLPRSLIKEPLTLLENTILQQFHNQGPTYKSLFRLTFSHCFCEVSMNMLALTKRATENQILLTNPMMKIKARKRFCCKIAVTT